MDPCKTCLVVAACQDNCEIRINYVKRRVKLIDIILVSISLTFILLFLMSIGMSVYIGMTDARQLQIVWMLKATSWKMSVAVTIVLLSFFNFLKIPAVRYKRKLKALIGDA